MHNKIFISADFEAKTFRQKSSKSAKMRHFSSTFLNGSVMVLNQMLRLTSILPQYLEKILRFAQILLSMLVFYTI